MGSQNGCDNHSPAGLRAQEDLALRHRGLLVPGAGRLGRRAGLRLVPSEQRGGGGGTAHGADACTFFLLLFFLPVFVCFLREEKRTTFFFFFSSSDQQHLVGQAPGSTRLRGVKIRFGLQLR